MPNKIILKLIDGNNVILDVPLSSLDWSKDELEKEFDAFEEDFKKFSCMFEALSNITRVKMMRKVVENKDQIVNFADFMKDLDLNPKTVWENSRKLKQGGFLKKISRGTYHCSELGLSTFLALSLVLRKIIESLEKCRE